MRYAVLKVVFSLHSHVFLIGLVETCGLFDNVGDMFLFLFEDVTNMFEGQ